MWLGSPKHLQLAYPQKVTPKIFSDAGFVHTHDAFDGPNFAKVSKLRSPGSNSLSTLCDSAGCTRITKIIAIFILEMLDIGYLLHSLPHVNGSCPILLEKESAEKVDRSEIK